MHWILAAMVLLPALMSHAQPDAATLLMQTDAAVRQYSELSYTFKYRERMRDKGIVEGDMDMKVQEAPSKRVWVRARKPDRVQLIWGKTEDRVWVYKGIKFKLPPLNKQLMKNSHHPLYRAGFTRTRDILMQTYRARTEEAEGMFSVIGSVVFDGRDCWHVVLTDHNYRIVNYTVREGDNVLSLAEERAIPEMRILELNPAVRDYLSLTPGERIRIPTSYGKVTTLYVDKATYLPIYQRVEDDLGLFTEYKHLNLRVNPGFTQADFEWQ